MVCGRCGKRNPEDARFCEECGNRIENYEVEEQKGHAVLTVIVVCIVASIALLAGIILGMKYLF